MPARVKKKPKKATRPAARRPAPRSARRAPKPRPKPSKKKPSRAAPVRRPAPKKAKKLKKPGKPANLRDRQRLAKAREQERARAQREKERERAAREREKEKAQREREKERAQSERERERATRQREKEKARLQKEKERALAAQQKDRERQAKALAAEKLRQAKLREQERLQKLAEREAARKAREAEQQRQREEARRAKEEEKAEREREREREREEARKAKEEERARREAEREEYRKAKEAERERLRAEREAARRALEGKVARATKRAQRVAGVGRGGTTRVYRPDLIPNQAGTTRRVLAGELPEPKPPVVRPPPPELTASLPLDAATAEQEQPTDGGPVAPPPGEEAPPAAPKPEPPPDRLDERYASILTRLAKVDNEFQREYAESFDMSWIYHDSALEGVVYTFQELKTAIDPNITVVPDSSLQPVCEEIRRHKSAIDLVRELAEKKRVPINVDMIKKLYLTLHPEEGDLKSVKYRKDIPQHRLYFHEYAPPDKIAYRMRQVIDWLNGPEPKKIKSPIRIASRVHYDLLRIFPFPNDSGKVTRLLMNLILLRNGYPPAIIHSTERQRYYEALKGSLPTIVQMVQEAIMNALVSIEKKLDEHESRMRAYSV
jgi:hypothetical protein